MHAIQTSGNCVRNITTDHFAGVAADEIVDPFVWAEVMRQWSTFHPEFGFLPRKFKIAINGSVEDRAATLVHDIGVHAVRSDAGEIGFRVIVGGGLGRTPIIGHVIREFLPWRHLLTYLDAILRVYNRYGRRDNKYKARIKILVKDVTPAGFAEQVEAEWAHLRDGPGTLVQEEIDRVAAQFTRAAYAPRPAELAQQEAAQFQAHLQLGPGVCPLGRAQCPSAPGSGLFGGDVVAEEDGGTPGRRNGRSAGCRGRPGGPLQLRRDSREPRAEPGAR